MKMPQLVTITGTIGNIGKALAERLLQSNLKIYAVARNAERLADLTAKGAEAYVGDIENTAFLTETFLGADAAFAMIPSSPNAPDLRADQLRIAASLSEALKTADVSHVVALSSAGTKRSLRTHSRWVTALQPNPPYNHIR
jgi:uncharacterized protein YbjT (DUF2867 family)